MFVPYFFFARMQNQWWSFWNWRYNSCTALKTPRCGYIECWLLTAFFLWQTTLIAPALVFIFFLHLFSHINKTLTSDLLILLCFYSYTECFPFRSELIIFVVVYTHTLFRAYCIRVTIFQLYFFFACHIFVHIHWIGSFCIKWSLMACSIACKYSYCQ